jgi:hypothetical protein
MKRTYPFLRYGALLSTILLLTNCTFKDDINELKENIDDFTVYLTTPEFNTGVHFEFVDARTNEIIDDKDVTVTVSGQDAALLYNNIGSKQESYTSNWGTLDLIVDPHKADSASLATKPIQFAVTASLEGYSSKTQAVTIQSTNKQKVRVLLNNLNTPPEGVVFAETQVAVTTGTDGKLSESITVEIGGEAALTMAQRIAGGIPTSMLELAIPQNTSFQGPDHQTIENLFGLTFLTEIEQPRSPSAWHFIPYIPYIPNVGFIEPLGSYTLNVYANTPYGQIPISGFTSPNPVNLGFLLPPTNPFTQSPFNDNDRLYALDEAQRAIRAGTILNNRFLNELNPDDLNRQQQIGRLIPGCTSSNHTIVFEFADPAATGSGTITTQILNTNESKVFSGLSTTYSGSATLTQFLSMQLPQGGGKIKLTSTGNLKFTPEIIVVDNFCDTKTHRVKVESATPPAGQDWINLNIDVSVTAESNSNFVIKPTLTVYYGTSEFTALDLKNGKASLQITEGTEYKIRGAIGDTKAQGRFKVESNGPTSYKLTFTEQLTSGGSGAVMTLNVPKTATNEVTLKYVFPVSDDVLNNFK